MDPMKRKAWSRWVAAAGTLMLALTLSGCDNPIPGGSMDRANELKSRPSYEDGAADYVTMLDEMKQAISKRAPGVKWRLKQSSEVNWAGCVDPYSDVNEAEVGSFDSGDADGRIPDDVWPQVKNDVIAIAAKHGFAKAQSLKDEPGGEHVLVIRDQWEGSVELGTLVNTTLVVYGSCMLHSAPRPSGTPSTQ